MATEAQQPTQPQTEKPLTPVQTKEVVVRNVLGVESPSKDPNVQKRIEEFQAMEPRSMLESIQDARGRAASEQEGEKENKDLAERGNKVAQESIGWNEKEGKRTLEMGEQGRLKDVSELTKNINDYLTTDFDKLSSKQKESAKGEVEKMLRVIPEFDNFLKNLPEKGKSVALNNLLKNPELRAVVRGVYEGTLNTSEASNDAIKDRVVEANKELIKAKNESEKKHAEYLGKKVNLDDVSEQLKQFEDNAPADGGKGTLLKYMERLQADKPKNEAEIEKIKDEITDISKRATDLLMEQDSPWGQIFAFDNSKEVDDLASKVGVLEEKKKKYEAKIDRIQQLKDKRNDISTKKVTLVGDVTTLLGQDNDAKTAEIEAQNALDAVKAEKAAEEQKFVNELKNTFRNSAGEFVEIKAALVGEKNAEIVDEKEATDEFGKKFRKALNDRWSKDKIIKEGAWPIPGRKTRESKVPDIDKINGDLGKLLKEGPDAVLKNILTENCGLSAVEADAKMQDKEFVDGEGKKIVDQLLSKKFQTGQITGAEAAYIANADWGQGAIQRAIEKNKEIQSAFKTLSEQGVLKGSTPQEWVKEIAKSNRVNSSILAALFGLLLLPVLGVKALGDSIKESYNSSTAL